MKEKICTVEEEVLFKKGTGGYLYYRIPGILPVRDALLLVLEARNSTLGDWGDIDILILRREADGELRQVHKIGESSMPSDGTMRTYNNPVLIPDEDRVHLIYHKNYEQAFLITSFDDGRTWNGGTEITASYRQFPYQWNVCATGPGHGIRTSAGRLVAPIWLADGKVSDDGLVRAHAPSVAGCIYSDDHGQTWQAGALAQGLANGNETTVAEMPDGKLLFNYRNTDDCRRRALSLSCDGGESLRPRWFPEELVDPRCFGSMISTEGGILFANCDDADRRIHLTVKRTRDEGGSWETVWEVDPVGGYPDIAVQDGRVYLFYERQVDDEIAELVLATGVWDKES